MRVGGNWAFVHGLAFGVSLGDFFRTGENGDRYLFMDWQSFVYFGQSFVCEAKVMDWFLRVGEN